jgi:hypothetical protein
MSNLIFRTARPKGRATRCYFYYYVPAEIDWTRESEPDRPHPLHPGIIYFSSNQI